jgi:hypothetical protein
MTDHTFIIGFLKIKHMGTKWSKLNTLETKMAKISHTKIKQPSFGEKRSKLTYTVKL